MKLFFTFLFLIPGFVFGQADSLTLVKLDSMERMDIALVHVIHYSGQFGKLRSNGHILSDSLGNKISKSMFAASHDDSTIFYYSFTKYYSNGTIAYDSIIDMRKHKTAKSSVLEYTNTGILIRKWTVKAKLDKKRTDFPKRTETYWTGTEIFYDTNGKETSKKEIEAQVF